MEEIWINLATSITFDIKLTKQVMPVNVNTPRLPEAESLPSLLTAALVMMSIRQSRSTANSWDTGMAVRELDESGQM